MPGHIFVIQQPEAPRPKEFAVQQIAALPYRTRGDATGAPAEVLLVTSRGTGRWVIPKGNRRKRETPHLAAAREAMEEAGVTGAIRPAPLGSYVYGKVLPSGTVVQVEVQVFALAVADELPEWSESGERTRRWFAPATAADLVDEPDLRALIRQFADR